jgi:hypothetical protein
MDAFQTIARIEPANPQHFYQMAVYYEERVRKDFTITPQQARDYLARGHEAIDAALQRRPDYFEALTYKNLLLRQQARLEADPVLRRRLVEDADEFQRRAIEVRNARPPGVTRPGPP